MLARIDDNGLDTGARSAGTERYCVVAREVKPVGELIRFVVGPDGSVVPDLKRNLPGRGLWITGTKDALIEAIRRKIFARGFKREVRVSADLADATGRLLERAVLDALAIAAKAGHVVAGFAKVEAAIARDRIAAILHASDAAADGIRKLDAALRRRLEADAENGGGNIVTAGEFTTAQLDLAMGRSNVVHAALLAGPASEGFLSRYSRLTRFRTGDANKAPGSARHRKPEGLDSE